MYEELVCALKKCGYPGDVHYCRDCFLANDGGTCHRKKLLPAAADAIEELSKRETPMKITEIHVDEYYCPACGAENNCDQGYVQDAYCPACGQRLLPESPKEEEK